MLSIIKHYKLYIHLCRVPTVVLFVFLLEYKSNGVTKSFVERVFGGELTSTLMCTDCKTVSMVTEVFLDLSLPVANEVKNWNYLSLEYLTLYLFFFYQSS